MTCIQRHTHTSQFLVLTTTTVASTPEDQKHSRQQAQRREKMISRLNVLFVSAISLPPLRQGVVSERYNAGISNFLAIPRTWRAASTWKCRGWILLKHHALPAPFLLRNKAARFFGKIISSLCARATVRGHQHLHHVPWVTYVFISNSLATTVVALCGVEVVDTLYVVHRCSRGLSGRFDAVIQNLIAFQTPLADLSVRALDSRDQHRLGYTEYRRVVSAVVIWNCAEVGVVCHCPGIWVRIVGVRCDWLRI